MEGISEQEVIVLAQKGNEEALDHIINKYKHIAKKKSRVYFLIGGDQEDVIQEGMIGLFKAIKDFNGDKGTSFSTFADLCISRQIMSAVKMASRQKHKFLNNYIAFNSVYANDEAEQDFTQISTPNLLTPEEYLILKEDITKIDSVIENKLSKTEKKVLKLYLKGESYNSIAVILGKDEKGIDNALQRVRKKLKTII